METKDKLKLALTITILSAFSILATTHFLKRRKQKPSHSSPTLCYLHSTTKPQSSFKRVLADNSYSPFKHPSLTTTAATNNNQELHPYKEEITDLIQNVEIEMFRFLDSEKNVDMEMKEDYVWVDTEEELAKLVEVLSKERVFAVDTEQHSLHSFLGFTALLQISTSKEDYLVDTIALHDVMGVLRPVFADRNVCKVFHGADNDVIWLQRDFHIYVMNLFDTTKACEVLSKPHKSLAYLLETYCGVVADKTLQREDWRLRPLSGDMVEYARGDAHYLLYIADCLVTELKEQDSDSLDDKFRFVLEASRRSNMISLQLFTKEVEASPGDSAASSILSRFLSGQGGLPLKCETKELVGRLCMWRDLMARVHDESLRYVLSDQAIAALASKVPKTATEIYDTISEVDPNLDSLSVGSFLHSPSAVVCSHLEDVFYLLSEKTSSLDEVFEKILQKNLGGNASCPLSIYNYALLAKSKLVMTNGFSAKQKRSKVNNRIGRKASRQLFVQKFSCKAPVYHNCRIYASDGRLLCYCDRRKLEWYLRRDLAKLVDNDPLAIMLLFEPKGRPEDEDNDFYIQSKKNMCVGCGERNHYLRYRIIPSCYRVHFPEHLKSHRSHDIVLLCVDCHEIAHSAAEKHKRKIAGEFGIPLFVKNVTDSSQAEIMAGTSASVKSPEEPGVSPLQLRTAAMALLCHGPHMPAKRREELTKIVMKFFGGRDISEKDLERALLVGMSPHEKRRLEKKRGLSFKHFSGHLLSNKGNENTTDILDICSLTEISRDNFADGSQITEGANSREQEDQNITLLTDCGVKDTSFCSRLEVDDKSSATGSEDLKLDEMKISKRENVLDSDEEQENISLPDEISNSYSSGPISHKFNKKLSLLGHGPHGKLVVDHLLKKYGEDGVRQFCQRWRQVFVEAIHPRFLPDGWDVMHSGRRDFGEYSVYNPTKKATTTVSS